MTLLANQFVSSAPGAYWCSVGDTSCVGRSYEVDYDIQCSYFGPG